MDLEKDRQTDGESIRQTDKQANELRTRHMDIRHIESRMGIWTDICMDRLKDRDQRNRDRYIVRDRDINIEKYRNILQMHTKHRETHTCMQAGRHINASGARRWLKT